MSLELNATLREDQGKGASRRLRHAKQLPAIVYGGKADPVSISLLQKDVQHKLPDESFYSQVLSLNIDGKAEDVLVRDIQHHPYKVDVMHIDFQRIDAKKKMHIHVPIHFTGEDVAPGVKAGGLVSHVANEVEIECLPKDIPEFIEVDVSGVNIGEAVHLTDLVMPKGVELAALSHGDENHDTAIVSIHAPKVAREETDEAPAAAAEEAPSED